MSLTADQTTDLADIGLRKSKAAAFCKMLSAVFIEIRRRSQSFYLATRGCLCHLCTDVSTFWLCRNRLELYAVRASHR